MSVHDLSKRFGGFTAVSNVSFSYRGNDALREAMMRLLGSRSLRSELRARGPERARSYGWSGSAATMTELLARWNPKSLPRTPWIFET